MKIWIVEHIVLHMAVNYRLNFRLFWVQLVIHSDSQISEVIVLNASFEIFSSKINVRDLSFKELSFVYVSGVSMPGKHEKKKVFSVHYFSPDRPKIMKVLIVDLS